VVAGVAVVVFAALLHRCLGIAARADDDGSDAVVIRLLDDFPGRFDVRLFAERSNRDTRLQLHRRNSLRRGLGPQSAGEKGRVCQGVVVGGTPIDVFRSTKGQQVIRPLA
jgi:hypothetical protein